MNQNQIMEFKTFQQHDVFPTRIHVAQDFLEEQEFQKMKLLVKEDKKYLDVPDFERKVMMHMGIICDNLGIDIASYDHVEISETWGNVLEKHQDHPVHTHSNHIFSGILYLTDGNPTTFLDPRPAADCFSLNYKDNTQCFYGARFVSPAVPNTLVIFPSWLGHFVVPNKTDKVRKSVSFNILLRGKYGIDNSLQEVVL
tara:strand:- start:6 stop:599 length:594 start_codon:yes stop_codon:yes gene_type:complete